MRVAFLYFAIGYVFLHTAVVSIMYSDFVAMFLRVSRSQTYCWGVMNRNSYLRDYLCFLTKQLIVTFVLVHTLFCKK